MPYRKKRNFRKRARVARRAAGLAKSKAFKRAVKTVMRAGIETKQAYHIMAPTNYNSGIDSAGDAVRVLPNVLQGVGENNRIGNLITGKTLSFKGAISWSPSVGTFGTFANARLGVRVLIVQPRGYSVVNDVLSNTATWMPTLLQKGGTITGFTGAINDLWAPINSDAIIKYYDKVYYLNGTYQSTAVGMTQLLGATKMFNIRLKMRNKKLKYDSTIGGGSNPTNYAPVFCIGYAHMDGSGPDVVSTAVTAMWDSTLNYEDA